MTGAAKRLVQLWGVPTGSHSCFSRCAAEEAGFIRGAVESDHGNLDNERGRRNLAWDRPCRFWQRYIRGKRPGSCTHRPRYFGKTLTRYGNQPRQAQLVNSCRARIGKACSEIVELDGDSGAYLSHQLVALQVQLEQIFEGIHCSSSRSYDFTAFRTRSFVRSKADSLTEIERGTRELAVFVRRDRVRLFFRYWLLFSDLFPWLSSGKPVLISMKSSKPVSERSKSMPVVEEIGSRAVHEWRRHAQAGGWMFSSRLEHLLTSADPTISVTYAAEFNR